MKLVGIRFKKACRVYTFSAENVECTLGEWVVVETERGMALGQVAEPCDKFKEPPNRPLKKVLRLAEDRDILRYEQNCEMEGYAFQFCVELIAEKKVPMKLVDVEYLFDGSKAIFYFTADGRVDFRELVRDLARQFHTRIEMRQIGVRDEAKIVGGVGCCGHELCCATWLTEFAPISVKMAKDQSVSLNPAKISGVCGRLMCCLSYEHKVYIDCSRDMPKIGKTVETPSGEGKVIRQNILERTFAVQTETGEVIVSMDEFKGLKKKCGRPCEAKTDSGEEASQQKRSRPPRGSRGRSRGDRPQKEEKPQQNTDGGKENAPPKTTPEPQGAAAPAKKRRRRRRRRGPRPAAKGNENA